MADDFIEQPLLSNSTDELQKKTSTINMRLRHSRRPPSSIETLKTSTDKPSGLLPRKFRLSFSQVAMFLIIYLTVGCICFYLVKDQLTGKKTDPVLDALYFCIVTMTTVGYGDLVPSSDASKLLACAFVFTGMAVVALFLSKSADHLVEKQEIYIYKALHMRSKSSSKAQIVRQVETNKMKYKFYTAALLLTMLVITGTVFLWKVEKLNFVDSIYCVCATVTTLGYGDKSFSTKGGRLFAVFWIVISTLCVAQFFFYLAEWNTEHRQKLLAKWVLARRMTYVDLEKADLDGDNLVGAAEFIVYKLKEMGKISEEDIATVLEEFYHLDNDQSGTLSVQDLNLSQAGQVASERD